MRILFIGDLIPWSRSQQRLRALRDLGHDVAAHASIPPPLAAHGRWKIADRLLWRVGLPRDLTQANSLILEKARRNPPDVLWIEKGNTIWPRTLALCRQVAADMKIVSYSEDDMFALHNRSLFYTWGVKHYDVVFTTKSYNCRPQELPALGARRVVFVDKAYDPHTHRPVIIQPAEAAALGSDVTFVGSFERERARSLLYLAKSGVQVRVWGCGWQRWTHRHPNLRVEGRPVYGESYVKVLCASKVNLCFLRKMNRDLQTDRTMEIPACGTLMLAERTHEHLRLFREDQEAAYFSSDEELVAKARYYLTNDEKRRAMASAARKRCLTSGYSHHDRLHYMLSLVDGAAT